MKNKNPLTAIFIALLFVSSTANSQEEKVILYNSQPVKVHLDGDKIAAFVGEAPAGYMHGYDVAAKEAVKPNPKSIDKPVIAGNSVNGEYAIVSSERIMLQYKEGYATLSKETINLLNTIATKLREDSQAKVLLTATTSASATAKDKKIAENRLSSALTYLKIKGVSIDRIQKDILLGDGLSNVVTAAYLR